MKLTTLQAVLLLCIGCRAALAQAPSAENGDNLRIFNLWRPYRWALSEGTAASPITVPGPVFKISKTESIRAQTCRGNQVDNECNAALSVNALQTADSEMQANAIFAGATGSSTDTNGSPDVVGINATGRVTGRGVGIGTGAYLDGRRDTETGRALGVEVRAENETAKDGTYNRTGISRTQGIWVTTSSSRNSNSGAAISVGGVKASKWMVGLGFVTGSVVTDSINDSSSSTTSLHIEGSHAFAIKTNPSAGAISLGGNVTLPHAIGGSATAGISAGSGAGSGPVVSRAGTDLAGQITVQTGSSPAARSSIAEVTFGTVYGSAPFCVYSPSSEAAAVLSGETQVRISTSTAALVLTSGPVALPAGNYVWNYVCAQ